MRRGPGGYTKYTALALRFHCLFEALELGLLPPALNRSVMRLTASAAERRGFRRRAHEVGRVFAELCGSIGLPGLGWPEAGERTLGRAVRTALRSTQAPAEPRAAAERLGRLCEEIANAETDRRRSGRYYTPAWAADAIARPLVAAVLDGPNGAGHRALSLRALDPAAGAGAFLIALVEAIAEREGEDEGANSARRAAVRRCVSALELDFLAAEACRLGLWLAASRPRRLARVPEESVTVVDALARHARGAERTFDLVIGNPPWGVSVDQELADRIAEHAPEALHGHRDSFLFFLHLAAEWTGDEGGVGMLLPDVILWQTRYEQMRRWLLERFRPLRVVLLGDRVFPGATAPACILSLAGKRIAPKGFTLADLRRMRRRELPQHVDQRGWSAEREAPVSAAHHSFLVAPRWQRRLLERMRRRHPTLADLEDVFTFHDAGINYPRAEVGRAILYHGSREDLQDIPVVRGRDFGAFTRIGSSAWLRHDWRARVSVPGDVSVRESVYHRTPKLLIRQTADRPVATLDRDGVYFGRSVIAVTAARERDLLWLAAVLNSDVYAALYRAVAPEAGRPFAQVKVGKLKVIPVPRAGPKERQLADRAETLLTETEPGPRGQLLERIHRDVIEAYGLSDVEAARVADVTGRGPARTKA